MLLFYRPFASLIRSTEFAEMNMFPSPLRGRRWKNPQQLTLRKNKKTLRSLRRCGEYKLINKYIEQLNSGFGDTNLIEFEKVALNNRIFYLSKTKLENGWSFYLLRDSQSVGKNINGLILNQVQYILYLVV